MHLLLSNDDGVYAQGLQTLTQALAPLATSVTVMAPDRDRSGASNALSLDRPLHARQVEAHTYSVNGTPTDCVNLGVSGRFGPIPDQVISGINQGANLGDDVLYSGTVAAAMEGRFLGRPAWAVSLAGRTHFETAATWVVRLLKQAHKLQLPERTLLNINVPDVPLEAVRGIQVTRLGHRHPSGAPIEVQDPRGQTRYWIAAVGAHADAGQGTDFAAIAAGYVSVTPLQMDMTRYPSLDQVALWLNSCTL
ncbi:5'-nucleotidase [Allopseudospirillum japonicum]|uniref:5'-nucleotidase SurE n=1 Tax=Allopseudospirillum japonicum TaxID=64971 RepID=A0A1H6R4A4_9GAMM|nr:5'/3'-nucleotidase SurE [Allopseudospirillum japonicum]SEI48054.1 5'-nucleotidase [Allopseudospirillum japonicum]